MRLSPLVGLVALCAAGPVSAATYYVSPDGNDGFRANSVSTPFRTLQKAASQLQAGDSIVMAPGIYREGATIEAPNVTLVGLGNTVLDGSGAGSSDGLHISNSGVTLQNTTFRNWRRAGVWAPYAQGLTVKNCDSSNNAVQGFMTANASDVTFDTCVASHNRQQHGIYCAQSGDRLKILNCSLIGNGGADLQINAVEGTRSGAGNEDWISSDCLIAGNTIGEGGGNIGGAAINLMSVRNSLIVNNLIERAQSVGIAFGDGGFGSGYGARSNRVYHNTIVFAPGGGRACVLTLSGSTGNVLRDNILISGAGPVYSLDEAVDSDYNVINGSSSGGNDGHSYRGDPRLTSDYHLQQGSPAIDMGVQLYGTDKDGKPRPQGPNPDCGCYEFGGSGTGGGPAVPTGLTAAPGDGQVTLTWRANTGQVAGYSLYRSSKQNGTYTLLNSTPDTDTSYVDGGLTNGTTYWYKIAAVGTNDNTSAQSAAVSATPAGGQGGGGGGAVIVFDDLLRTGWKHTRGGSAQLYYTSVPALGRRSLGMILPLQDSFIQLQGPTLNVNGRVALKFAVNGGTGGRQPIQITVIAGSTPGATLNLADYGGAPSAGQWKQYVIPLADLGLSSTSVTGLRFSTTAARQSRIFVDTIRFE